MTWGMNFARWWADPKLVKENDDLRYRLVNAEAAKERLTEERDRAVKSLATSIATNDRWEEIFDEQAKELTSRAGQIESQADQIESLEQGIDAARAETRQAKTGEAQAKAQASALQAEIAQQRKAVQA